MRSLQQTGFEYSTSSAEQASSPHQRVLICVNTDTQEVFVATATDSSAFITRHGLGPRNGHGKSGQLMLHESGIALGIDDAEVEVITGLQHVGEAGGAVVAYGTGTIGLVTNEDEIAVGDVEAGIVAMAWAPDGETGVFVTGRNVNTNEVNDNNTALEFRLGLLLMTPRWDVITETPLPASPSTSTGAGLVSVGWGRKETQFHGSEGKQAAKLSTVPAVLVLTATDDRRPRVSWRGDSRFFAISYVVNEFGSGQTQSHRAVAIFTREGSLSAIAEPIANLHHAIAWRPLGNLIAAVQTLPSRQLQVVFFETNGLRHGEFSLRLSDKDTIVYELAYTADSSILAIFMLKINENRRVIQLWSMSNYHYYLKQEIYSFDGHEIDSFAWDPECALRLYVSSGGEKLRKFQISEAKYALCNADGLALQTFTFATTIQTSSSGSIDTSQPVIVTDGLHLLVTPFRTSNMPPPMSETKIGPFPFCVSSVAIGENDILAVLLADNSIYLASNINDQNASVIRRVKHSLPINGRLSTYRQIVYINPTTILLISSPINMSPLSPISSVSDFVVYLELEDITSNEIEVFRTGIIEDIPGAAESGIMKLNGNLRNGDVLVESMQEINGIWKANLLAEFPAPCPWIASVVIGSDADSLQTVAIGLSDRNKLYVNSRLISSEATSFFVHDDYIIVTTLSHTARFIPLAVDYEEALEIPVLGAMVHDESLRRVERGSRIVTAIPGDMKLILQMPRGNLETIYPRALVLSIIRTSLNKLNYSNAFILCRKHRINMNLLVDHNPKLFMDNVALFVSSVKEADYLNFLGDVDVTKTMYVPVPAPPKSVAYFKPSTKINTVCFAIRAALEQLDKVTYITTILTTYAKITPVQDLEGAMARVRDMKSVSVEETENALKYLIFLANANRLYDVALGMYDFQLVVMVAQFSQKDPREYLPFLTALKMLPKNHQYFRIDDHLGRYASALGHLSTIVTEIEINAKNTSANEAEANKVFYEEVIPYIVKHELFKDALERYQNVTNRLKSVLSAYGTFLFLKARFAESGLS
ncbi:hypothetical protein HK100_001597 [Physocladia obscura]|uniref:Elongator complex protein 1 n=1 Tax=Physocladia obscura TaxID=109957 RepID=A0AAD5T7R1_9FUNG|nr:hypothetical protein HK100_001597 [Physocladia obscura]